ncbi:MAG: LAGLIDADG family homing endonuclease, partial [Nanoarchaeota archaeon]|nr:hypothetical protein [Nanoarchaeota archaeon]
SNDYLQLYLSSKDKKTLRDFSNLLENKFKMKGKLEKRIEGFGESYKLRMFNGPFCRLIKLSGAPAGKKVIVLFDVPKWIRENKESSRNYLRIAFDCEGCVWRDPDGYPRIRFAMNKSLNLLEDGKKFIQSMKDMLGEFDIKTTKTWERGGYSNGIIPTKSLCFSIKTRSIKKFSEQIGFNIERKQKLLKEIVESDVMGRFD